MLPKGSIIICENCEGEVLKAMEDCHPHTPIRSESFQYLDGSPVERRARMACPHCGFVFVSINTETGRTMLLGAGVVPFNERAFLGFNESAKRAPCVVQIVRPQLLQAETYFAEGLPSVRTSACRGGANITIEFFVPDRPGKRKRSEDSAITAELQYQEGEDDAHPHA